MAFHFSRDTKVFMKFHASADGTDDALNEIPVLDGYSFSQATNSSEITLNEAADSSGNSKRGRAMFNDSFAPAEWSFSTYMRPTTSAAADTWASNGHAGSSKKFAVEGPLWGAMSATTYNLASGGTGAPTAGSWEPNVFNFQNSNKSALGVFDLYFVLGATKDTSTSLYTTGTEGVSIYMISDCSVGSASIDFDIEGLAQIAWSGQGKKLKEVTQLKTTAGATSGAGGTIDSLYQDANTQPIGDNFVINADAKAANGIVTDVEVIDSGFGYTHGANLTLRHTGNSNIVVSGTANVTTTGLGPGYWASDESEMNAKYIHDNDFYQSHSYVVETGLSLDKYRDILLKSAHIAGTRLFGKVIRESSVNNAVTVSNSSIGAV